MVDFTLILGILAVIALCVILYKLMEGLSNAVLSFNVIFFILLGIVGIALFLHIKTFSDSFDEKEKIILVEQNGVLKQAYSAKGNVTKEISISPYKEAFIEKNFDNIRTKEQIIIVTKSKDYNAHSIRLSIIAYKEGNLKIYPEPFFFKLTKIIPASLLGGE